MILAKPIPQPLPEHVFSNLNRNMYTHDPFSCWEWKGRKQKHKGKSRGYGLIQIDGSVFRVSRLLYFIVYKEDPMNNVIRHTCDNSHCVNPYHLVSGTQQENMKDAKRRGRLSKGSARPNAKLTEDLVKQIRDEWEIAPTSWRKGAKKYGICYSTFKSVVTGKTWKHV